MDYSKEIMCYRHMDEKTIHIIRCEENGKKPFRGETYLRALCGAKQIKHYMRYGEPFVFSHANADSFIKLFPYQKTRKCAKCEAIHAKRAAKAGDAGGRE